MTSRLHDFGVLGGERIISFIIVGLLFELVFLVLKLEVKHIQLDIVLGTAVAAASLPLSAGMLLSSALAIEMISRIINMMIFSFFVGMAGALLSFLLWYYLRTAKLVLRFEYLR